MMAINWISPRVTYPWMIDMLGNDHAAALLLNQMVYWYIQMKMKPYYKFIDAPEGDDAGYKEGDSWCEEMCMSYEQFKRARAVFSTKINRPASLVTQKFDDNHQLLPVTDLVYWWYQRRTHRSMILVNMSLLYAYQEVYTGAIITLGNVDTSGFEIPAPENKISHLLNTPDGQGQMPRSDKGKTPDAITKTTTETKTETTKDSPDGDADGIDLLFNVIAKVAFGIHDYKKIGAAGGRVGKIKKALLKAYPSIVPLDVEKFGRAYKQEFKNASVPRDSEKFLLHYVAWNDSFTAEKESNDFGVDVRKRAPVS